MMAHLAAMLMLAADQTPIEGNAASAVRVIIYEDLACSDCALFRVMMDEKILPRFAKTAAFEHRDFPLPKHAWARPAAVAARYFSAVKPELGIEWRRYALAHLQEITAEDFNQRLASWAKEHGIDGAQAIAALADKKLGAAVEADYQDGIARGIARTPTVLVDGEPFIETFTFEEIAASLEKAGSGR